MIRTRVARTARVNQGDIIRDVEYIESVGERLGRLEIRKIRFPLVVVLTQDCDLAQDYKFRWSKQRPTNQDKYLLSVLVAPLYNVEDVYIGTHLSELGLGMQQIPRNKTAGNNLRRNETPRYHFIEFPRTIPVVPSVIDFKHYFAVSVQYIKKHKANAFVCQLDALFREDISQRFTAFLGRIGLPD